MKYVLGDLLICGVVCFIIGLWSGMILAAWICANEPGDQHMTVQDAKKVIREDPDGNICRRLEAIHTAEMCLGDDCTMADIYKWAEEIDG